MRKLALLWLAVCFVGVGLGLAQDSDNKDSVQNKASNNVVALEWVMGIVKSVDIAKKAIEVSYYDFENDKDAVITIYVTNKTEFLGSPSLKDINPGNDVEVSYTYSDDGRPMAEAVITTKFPSKESEKTQKEN